MDIRRKTDDLIRTIVSSEIYRAYQDSLETLKADADLFGQVNQYREECFHLNCLEEADNLIDRQREVRLRYRELLMNPMVTKFLDAEVELCRTLQDVNLSIAEGVKLDIPVGVER